MGSLKFGQTAGCRCLDLGSAIAQLTLLGQGEPFDRCPAGVENRETLPLPQTSHVSANGFQGCRHDVRHVCPRPRPTQLSGHSLADALGAFLEHALIESGLRAIRGDLDVVPERFEASAWRPDLGRIVLHPLQGRRTRLGHA